MSVLVTGGCGFIGSHTIVELINNGKNPIIVDNLSNSSIVVLDRIKQITGVDVPFYNTDVCDIDSLDKIFDKESIDSIIHFAGYKAVGESVDKPIMYYQNNIVSTLNILKLMEKYNIYNIIFSSSATVYGDPDSVPIYESFPCSVTNPYGRTKLMIEDILKDVFTSNKYLNIGILRYFNPIGAHSSGLIGEDPSGIPNNLLPYITKVLVGKLKMLNVFGNDYPTHDGTGVRDYIHVVDLALGHTLMLDKLETKPGLCVYNLGTGIGYSVLDIISTMEEVTKKKIEYKFVERRCGDIAECYANADKAFKELGWKANYDLKKMLEDSWNWQVNNIDGYDK